MFGGNGLDKIIETYINQIVSELGCDKKEKQEIVDEIKDHLYLLKNEYLEQGLSDKEATNLALESFGEQNQLKNGFQEAIFPFYKLFKIGTWILFGLYSFIVLFKLIYQRIIIRFTDILNSATYDFPVRNRYFSYPNDSNEFYNLEVLQLNSNIIPFKNILTYLTGSMQFNDDIIINNTLGNIVIFIPLGILLPILFHKFYKFSRVFISLIFISFSLEDQQLILQVGQFDIDNIILNTIGGVLGYFVIVTIPSITSLFQKTLS